MASVHALGGSGVLSHQVAAVDVGDLVPVLILLADSPLGFLGPFLEREAFVFLLQVLHHFVPLLGHLVLEHASHAVEGLGLLGVVPSERCNLQRLTFLPMLPVRSDLPSLAFAA